MIILRNILAFGSIIFLSCFSADASTTITLSALTSNKIVTSTDANLAAGSALRIGFFNAPGGSEASLLSILSSSNSYDTINSLFVPVGEIGNSSQNGAAGSGNVTVTTNNSSISGDVYFRANGSGNFTGQITGITEGFVNGRGSDVNSQSRRLYVWAFNTTNPRNATEWAIFTDPSYGILLDSDPNDAFPQDTAVSTTVITAGDIIRGTAGSIRLAPIPEPATAVFGLLGLGLLARRRRSA